MTLDVIPERGTETVVDASSRATEMHKTEPFISIAGIVKARTVEPRNAVIGGVLADDVRLERGFARTVFAGDKVELHKAGAQLVVAAGDVTLEKGGAQAVVTNGDCRITQGGAGIAAARRIDVGEQGTVVIALTPSLAVNGGRVLVGPIGGLALFAGIAALAFGAVRLRRSTG